MNFTELEERLQNITETYSGLTRLFSIGKSVEGRDLWVVEVSDSVHLPLRKNEH